MEEVKVGVNRKRQVNLFDIDGTRVELMEPTTVDGKPTPPRSLVRRFNNLRRYLMNSIDSRREFLAGLVASAAIPVSTALAFAGADRRIRFGYTAMTWGKEEKRAIEDISAAGFEGIQFRIDATTEFRPEELRETLHQRNVRPEVCRAAARYRA
jgi:hypothetical protein